VAHDDETKADACRAAAAQLMRESHSVENSETRRYLLDLAAKWLELARRLEQKEC
jgi:hypothetical protein